MSWRATSLAFLTETEMRPRRDTELILLLAPLSRARHVLLYPALL